MLHPPLALHLQGAQHRHGGEHTLRVSLLNSVGCLVLGFEFNDRIWHVSGLKGLGVSHEIIKQWLIISNTPSTAHPNQIAI